MDLPQQILRMSELVATNNLIAKRMASGSAALNDFCDEAAQLLLRQQHQIDTLLTTNKAIMERVPSTLDRTVSQLLQLTEAFNHAKEDWKRATTAFKHTADLVEGQDNRLVALEEIVRAQVTILPSWHATPEAAAEIREVLKLLAPRTVIDSPKQRFGRNYDGGYVMLDDFKGARTALSLGINDDVSWDIAMARRGLEVFQFDHTIDALPEAHELFHFNRLRIAAAHADGAVTLEQAILMTKTESTTPIILKMDIEGDEWDVLDHAPLEVLNRCNQIIVEFHHMERLMEPASLSQARRVFEKLTSSFFLCHVHGNNCGNLVNVHNIVLPETLEMTFAKATEYRAVDTQEVFPQALDMPNQPGRADFFLGSFRF